MRRCFEDEFTSIYVLNLRGNQRTSGELSRKEGGKIFGSGSRTPITITFLVKNPAKKGQKTVIHYHDIGDYLTREQKLKMVKDFRSISSQKLEWQIITPNEKADWINQRDGVFDNLIPLAPEKKFAMNAQCVFSTYAIGVATNRDAWVSGFSKDMVTSNMCSMIDFYNQQIDENKLSTDTTKISWTVNLKKDHESKVRHSLKENAFVETFYRPFNRINLYYHRPFIERPGVWRQLFPTSSNPNLVIAVSGIGQQKPFASLITNSISDLQVVDKAQYFPLYWYEENKNPQATLFDDAETDKYIRRDGITDWILKEVRSRFGGSKTITKEHIFYYVYGLLHSKQYRERFADDLKKSLPRIHIVDNVQDFMSFYKVGKELADLHLNYEQSINEQAVGRDGDYLFFAAMPMIAHRACGVRVNGDMDIWQNNWTNETYQYFAVDKINTSLNL